MNAKIVSLIALILVYGGLCRAMESKPEEWHWFPSLTLDYQAQKAIFKIASPEMWRKNNTYLKHKKEIVEAFDEKSAATKKYGCGQFNSLVLDPIKGKGFRALKKFFGANSKNTIENHYALMKECDEDWCPLSQRHLREVFEDDFVKRAMNRFQKTVPLRYVGFGAGLSLFSDLRILLKLKKAGYRFEKIQFIDPVVVPHIKYVQDLVQSLGAVPFELSRNGEELVQTCKTCSYHFEMIMNTNLVSQFLAILSIYDGDDVVEYYPTVKEYLADTSNIKKSADLITVFDAISPRDVKDGKANGIISDLVELTTNNKEALVGNLYCNYLAETKKSHFTSNKEEYGYTLISSTNECEGCKKLNGESYCSGCVVKKTIYCGTECQKKDWAEHKKQFHPNVQRKK